MKELIEKKIFEIVTACRQARIEIGLHDLEPEGRNKVIDEMLHRAIIKANELEAALKPRPIEDAPKDGSYVLLLADGLCHDARWVTEDDESWGNCHAPESCWVSFMDDEHAIIIDNPTHWLPLPSDGGEE